MFALTPSVNDTDLRTPIVLEVNDALQLDTGLVFEYRTIPTFIDIEPRSHLLV